MHEALINLADIALCTSNDFHLLHLNYTGNDYDAMHKQVLKEYYEQAANDYDTWAEAVGMYGYSVPTPNDAAKRINWQSRQGEVNYTTAVNHSTKLLETYCAALLLVFDKLEQLHSIASVGIANTIQTRLEYWSKELLYFNKRRQDGCVT